jgi:uncharacterized membrane protein YbaN (DUF454 family)
VFESVLGLPAHPLMVHAAVVLVPLLALGAIAYAVVPRLRTRIRWAVVLLAFVAPGAAFFAKESGDAFRARLIAKNMTSPQIIAQLDQHESYGEKAMLLAVGLGLVTLALAFLLPGSPNVDHGFVRSAIVQVIFAVVTVGLALVTMFYVYRTGDSGARMVWDGF